MSNITLKLININKFLTKTIKNVSHKVFYSNYNNLGTNNYLENGSINQNFYQEWVNKYFNIGENRKIFIIHPYIKWGPEKIKNISLNEEIEEAKSLVSAIYSWSVVDCITVPLENFQSKYLFKSGSLDKLKKIIRGNPDISGVFVNLSVIKNVQMSSLEQEFQLPIYDRYRIIVQILKMHGNTKESKLQVALAELQYIQRQNKSDKNDKIKLIFQNEKQKLEKSLDELKQQRGAFRQRRKKSNIPTVAVVGYTNSGKTSLIKTLTEDSSLKPKDQLFATLDVTAHLGVLPSGLKVLYVDTVGFISNIPTNLIHCFASTLEDAVFADVILHVEDLSSVNFEHKRETVTSILNSLGKNSGLDDIESKIISVGNKSDVAVNEGGDILRVSAETNEGIACLKQNLENAVLKLTDLVKISIRVPCGGDEIRWLYKNSTILKEISDEQNSQLSIVTVIITKGNIGKFKKYFI